MILSFHPCYVGERNILCAGREPDETDLAAIREARGVVLSQGCGSSLYDMARHNCDRVFPNYDVRFEYPGKCGQAALFEKTGARHPETFCFRDADAFCGGAPLNEIIPPLPFPFVMKLDWGGEGDTVYWVASPEDLDRSLHRIREFESSGQKGFVVQEFVPCGKRSLRIARVGKFMTTYWRVQNTAGEFGTSVGSGATIRMWVEPEIKLAAEAAVEEFCGKTGVNLAGFDLIFSEEEVASGRLDPYFLEINYFFGRRGLGGSERYYQLLESEIRKWIHETVCI